MTSRSKSQITNHQFLLPYTLRVLDFDFSLADDRSRFGVRCENGAHFFHSLLARARRED